MTLVAGLSFGGLPAFIGDLLVSWSLRSIIDLPTQQREGVHPGLESDYAAGLSQKLIVVRPYLLLAWAGLRAEVNRIAGQLDSVLPSKASEMRDPEVLFSILNTCCEGTELVALLIWSKAVYPFGVRTRGFELEGKRFYLLGSGAPEFFEYLQTHPDLLPNQEQADGQIARAAMLRFAARAMVSQWTVGAGLEKSWGGGFEIAFPEEDGFRKIGNVLFRAWMIDEHGACYNSGRSFFTRYYGHDLYLSCFNPEQKTYVIRSLIGEPPKVPEHEKVHPEWILDVFLMKENGSFVEFARFQPPHRPVDDTIELRNGMLVGWAMDEAYVARCAMKAREACHRGNRFDILRY